MKNIIKDMVFPFLFFRVHVPLYGNVAELQWIVFYKMVLAVQIPRQAYDFKLFQFRRHVLDAFYAVAHGDAGGQCDVITCFLAFVVQLAFRIVGFRATAEYGVGVFLVQGLCRKNQSRGACAAVAVASHQLYVYVRLGRIDDKKLVAHVDTRSLFAYFAKEGADFCFLAFVLLCMNAAGGCQ